jgi:GMP synthase (glutamine-hydrolysing)
MKALIINNSTTFLAKLLALCSDCDIETKVVSRAKFRQKMVDGFDLVILSGGRIFNVVDHQERYTEQITLLRESSIPILGICLGCELICKTFGGQLAKDGKKINGYISFPVNNKEKIFNDLQEVKVFESHRYQISSLGQNLIGLARSQYGYEVIQVASKMIYGFQFHPEANKETNSGKVLFKNFLTLTTHEQSN